MNEGNSELYPNVSNAGKDTVHHFTTTFGNFGKFDAHVLDNHKELAEIFPYLNITHLGSRVFQCEYQGLKLIAKQAPYVRPGTWKPNSSQNEFTTARYIEKYCDLTVFDVRFRSERPYGYVTDKDGKGYVIFEYIDGAFSDKAKREVMREWIMRSNPEVKPEQREVEMLFRYRQLDHLRQMINKGTKMYYEDNNNDDGALVIPQGGGPIEFVRVDFEHVWAPWGPFSSKYMSDGDLEFINRWYLSKPHETELYGQMTTAEVDHFQSLVKAYLIEIQSMFGEEEYRRITGSRKSL